MAPKDPCCLAVTLCVTGRTHSLPLNPRNKAGVMRCQCKRRPYVSGTPSCSHSLAFLLTCSDEANCHLALSGARNRAWPQPPASKELRPLVSQPWL